MQLSNSEECIKDFNGQIGIDYYKEVLIELEKLGSEQTKKIFVNHGAHDNQLFGVKVGDLKVLQKKIKHIIIIQQIILKIIIKIKMKKYLLLSLLLSVVVANAQHAFFRGTNNYIAPVAAVPTTSNGLGFDGIDDGVVLNSSLLSSNTNELTYELWLKPYQLGGFSALLKEGFSRFFVCILALIRGIIRLHLKKLKKSISL